MKVLSRYLANEFLKLFFLCEGVFVFIYLMIDLLENVDNFIEAKASEGTMLLFFLYKIPFIVTNMIPPATLGCRRWPGSLGNGACRARPSRVRASILAG